MLPINLNSPGYTGRKGRYKMAQKTGGGGDKPSKYLGSGHQGYGQQNMSGGYGGNFYGAANQPWFNPYRFNAIYPGLIVWRI